MCSLSKNKQKFAKSTDRAIIILKGDISMIDWIKGTTYNMIVTVSSKYITLNNSAAARFSNYKWCMIGIDKSKKKLCIKPISKNDIDLHLYPLENLHKLNFGNGYIRISSKAMLLALQEVVEQPLDMNIKYKAYYNDNEDMLIVELDRKED